MKIDVFTHIMPEVYKARLEDYLASDPEMQAHARSFPPPLYDMKARFSIMDRFEGLQQVVTLAEPAIELVAGPEKAAELARLANDGIAGLVRAYPERFAAGVAALPLNNIKATLEEIDRAINDLGLKGILLYSSVNDRPLDSPEFLPIYKKMAQHDLPIWIHPARTEDYADYRTESRSYYGVCGLLGWPHETTVAMFRLSCSGILEEFPGLKFITHHCGGTAPYLAARMGDLGGLGRFVMAPQQRPISREPLEYMKMFYGDTAIFGEVTALMCGYTFFGAERMLFGTDMPFCIAEPGISGTRQTIEGIENMAISDVEKQLIFEGNARRLLHLT